MLGEIARFLLNTVFTLFGAALLLRAWMQAVRVPPYNPVTQAVLQATNWIVLPLRRVITGTRGIDWASVVAALLTAFVYVLLMMSLAGIDALSMLPTLVIVALLTLVKWALNLVLWMTILMALLSWLNPRSPAMEILFPLTAPLLNPLRRVLPNLGGLDLSPILLFVIVQVLIMIVTRTAISMTLFTL
ncbi:YggT family protein [Burkholderia glumae]|uniref:YggT family protein n=1 Tax=Burkholderia glumae TaxID=337 RepID=A0AAP9Y6E7_BURGL|nr:YggT family protein [Burkholderia glumae]ACR27971.1 membrane protein, YGGT family [Burkholderia glumae BGR1]AJY66089.1 YGGT family protein [Burkholderia glumae LMG 2196 = ATCC 33617]KHJ60465.1 membrane protein [Burkholderia glumae]MCM2481049.1 YggT family protein [Burkholderia glumae]MCM2492264.1 YggT family protein [Burkholderia glumae]